MAVEEHWDKRDKPEHIDDQYEGYELNEIEGIDAINEVMFDLYDHEAATTNVKGEPDFKLKRAEDAAKIFDDMDEVVKELNKARKRFSDLDSKMKSEGTARNMDQKRGSPNSVSSYGSKSSKDSSSSNDSVFFQNSHEEKRDSYYRGSSSNSSNSSNDKYSYGKSNNTGFQSKGHLGIDDAFDELRKSNTRANKMAEEMFKKKKDSGAWDNHPCSPHEQWVLGKRTKKTSIKKHFARGTKGRKALLIIGLGALNAVTFIGLVTQGQILNGMKEDFDEKGCEKNDK